MMLSLDTAYRSFGGEVEASSTPTICRLPDSRRHQLSAIAQNRRSGRKMSDAIFVAKKASGRLAIGDKKEIDRATWRKPRGIRLTPTSRNVRDRLFPKGQ